jgi:hypothetical protein
VHEPIRATDEATFPHVPPVIVHPPATPAASAHRALLTVVVEGAAPGFEARLRETLTQNGLLSGTAEVFTQLARMGHRGTVTVTIGDGKPLVWRH